MENDFIEQSAEYDGSAEPESTIAESAQRDYRIWKKNSPFLYDYLSTNSLVWPSLTVQFFPDLTTTKASDSADEILQQRLLLGTFTLGQSTDSVSIVQHSYYKDLNSNLTINKLDYNHDKEEFEVSLPSSSKLKVLQKINHYGDVNKVQYMPQKPNVLASANNLGDLVIYERTKHSNFKNDLTSSTIGNKVQLTLEGHTATTPDSPGSNEIFALDWNKQKEGTLVSGNMVGDINIFDIRGNFSSNTGSLSQSSHFSNPGGINDIEWFPYHDSLFAVVDETGYTRMYDSRLGGPVPDQSIITSSTGVNSVALNKHVPSQFATGDSQGVVKIWDMRYCLSPLHTIQKHADSITQLRWHPKIKNLLASSSSDATLNIYDVEKVGNEDNGLIFVHSGHMLGVNDFDWSHHDDWMIGSVADDNSLHVWKPTSTVRDAISKFRK